MQDIFRWGTLFLCVAFGGCAFQSNESFLATKLLKNYNREMRPFNKHFGNKVRVNLGMTLSQIISVKEKTQEMTTSVYVTIKWEDDRFSWNPKDYEDIGIVRMPPQYIWTPRIVLENNKDGSFDVSLNTNVLIYRNGTVEWLPPALYKSSCMIDVSLFPFDWQNCTMVFRSATYDRSEMEFGLVYGPEIFIDPHAFQPNGEWDLIQKPIKIHNSSTDPVYEDVIFYFIIRRRPQFYVMNLILPCILLTSLSCFVFYLPSISCEKMTLSISILLGQTVFLFLIAQRTPETSLAIPLIAGYLLFSMILVIISVIGSVIVCNVHFRSNMTHKMPNWVVWFFMETLAPFLNVERPVADETIGDGETSSRRASSVTARRGVRERFARKAPSETLFDHHASRMGFRQRHLNGLFGLTEVIVSNKEKEKNFFPMPNIQTIPASLKSTIDSICYIAKHKKIEDKRSQSQDDWAYVALILDRALFWIYLAIFSLGTMGFFLQTAVADYPEAKVGTASPAEDTNSNATD